MLGFPRRLSAALVALVVLAAVPVSAALQEPAAAIAEANAALSAALAAGDLDSIVAGYTEDAMFMAPNAPAAKGHDAIREAFAGFLAMGAGSLQLTTDELEVFGDTAHEVGRFVLEGADGSHMDHGKYIVIWKRTDDGWKLHRDIFNSDMAPPQG
jgi:ketosteroid isomerase-like protein